MISNNQGDSGVILFSGCSAHLNNVMITDHANAREGLHISASSSVFGHDVTVSNNPAGIGVVIRDSSIIAIDNNLTVTNNGDVGVSVDDSRVRISNSTITGNLGPADLSASFGSRLILNGNTINTIACDATVLSSGDTVCP